MRIDRKTGSPQTTASKFAKGMLQKCQANPSASPFTGNGQGIDPTYWTCTT
nr:hypothetical protein [Ktedonobacter robiniae]